MIRTRPVWLVLLATLFISLLWSQSLPALELASSPNKSEAILLSNVRQLIFEGRRSGEGYFSADGTQMIFQSEREAGNPFYQMYLMDLETGDIQRVSPGMGKTTCGWIHPHGGRVLFASTHKDPQALVKQKEELDKRAQGRGSRYSWSFDEYYDLYEADLADGSLRQLTEARGYDAEGSWSPDGSWIAFASNRHAYQETLNEEERQRLDHDKSYFMEIYIMDSGGDHVRRLTYAPGYDGGPFFSPDGKQLVWRRFNEEGTEAEIWTMQVDGSQARPITELGVLSWAPFFHPSGDYVIFATNKHGFDNFELYLVDAEGRSEPVRVTYTKGFDGLPVFSPDGKQLSWASSRTAERTAQIFLADWNDAAARRLLNLEEQKGSLGVNPSAPRPNLSSTAAAIRPADLRQHVNYLASPALGGRLTGSSGERLATEYVAEVFRALDLQPAGDNGSYFQTFEFTAGGSLGPNNQLNLYPSGRPKQNLVLDEDWRPLAFSETGAAPPAEVVFVGYGIQAPASDQFEAYDSYAEVDPQGKWVMMFRYLPEDVEPERRQHLSNYSELRYKAMLARDKGALGLILVSGPNARVKSELVRLDIEAGLADAGLYAFSVSDEVAQKLLRRANHSLQELQDALDQGDSVAGFTLADWQAGATIDIRKQTKIGRNVLARLLAGASPSKNKLLIGAHVDHIGDGTGLDSLASRPHIGLVHPGADDNASGVAGLLEIAQYLTSQKSTGHLHLKRDVEFAVWSGEELGLLGSEHFVKQRDGQTMDSNGLVDEVIAYLNLDMIGRLRDQLYIQGVGSSSLWPREIERRNIPVGVPIVTQRDSYLPTDATSFYLKGVPVLSFFTGAHEEYNTPRDKPDTLNYQGLAKVANLVAGIGLSLAVTDPVPDYLATEKPTAPQGRRNLRAYLGTIPAYGENINTGVKLNGVAKGGPAEQAGLKAGDVIVEMAGRKIENIYDYSYALNAVKVGAVVEVTVLRNGRSLQLEVLPESRE